MIFEISKASDAYMDRRSLCHYSPYENSVWDPVQQCWVVELDTPLDLVELKEKLGFSIRVDGCMPTPRVVIEDL